LAGVASSNLGEVRVVSSPELRAYVQAHGGTIYVAPRRALCCSGTILLEATTEAPTDLHLYTEFAGDGIKVFFRCSGRRPAELVLGLHGRRRRPADYWEGCAFVI
jgi:hypothetical protein